MNRIFKYALMFAFIGITIFAISQMSDHAQAADVTWDGGGADNLASTKENWIGDVIPSNYDNLYFDSTSQKNCNYDINIDPLHFQVNESYDGIITFNDATKIEGNFKIYSGTIIFNQNMIFAYRFWLNDCIIYQNSNFTISLLEGTTKELNNVIYHWSEGTQAFSTFNILYITNAVQFTNLYINNSIYINGQWTGNIYYNGTSDISTDQQHWTGWLYTQNDIAIEYNAYAYLAFQHDALLGVQLESWSGTDNFTWNATSVASQTVQWSWSRGESSAVYDEYQDTIYIGSSETNAGGMGTFTSTFVGSHAFLLSRSSFLPASTDISDDVWLGIVFMSIATLITLFGYIRRIGLVMIISFLLLVIGTLASTQIWVELWTLPTLFILVNAVLMTHGLLRKV